MKSNKKMTFSASSLQAWKGAGFTLKQAELWKASGVSQLKAAWCKEHGVSLAKAQKIRGILKPLASYKGITAASSKAALAALADPDLMKAKPKSKPKAKAKAKGKKPAAKGRSKRKPKAKAACDCERDCKVATKKPKAKKSKAKGKPEAKAKPSSAPKQPSTKLAIQWRTDAYLGEVLQNLPWLASDGGFTVKSHEKEWTRVRRANTNKELDAAFKQILGLRKLQISGKAYTLTAKHVAAIKMYVANYWVDVGEWRYGDLWEAITPGPLMSRSDFASKGNRLQKQWDKFVQTA